MGPARVGLGEEASKRLSFSGRPSLSARPSRPSMSSSHVQQNRRESGARTSGYSVKANSTIRTKDPRPIGDKAYISACTRTLIAYLTTNGYDHPISPKVLSSPTGKDFTNIVQFLFRKVDPHIKFSDKVVDDVPIMFKRLHYPFGISKSALSAVGSPHTWPALLVALTWIVELLTYEERAEEAKREAFDTENSQRNFFEYVAKSYSFFLAGDDNSCESLDMELAETFQARNQDAISEIERLEQVNIHLQEEIERLKSEPSPLVALQKKQGELVSELDRSNKAVTNLETQKISLQDKIEERKKDVRSKKGELERMNANMTDLREKIAVQEVNAADVERMTYEKNHLEETLQQVTSQRERLENSHRDQESQVEETMASLENSIRDYHTAARRLQIIPAGAKRAKGMDYEIRMDHGTEGPMLSLDVKTTVKPMLTQLKEQYAQKSREAQEMVLEMQEQLTTSEATLGERTEERNAAEVAFKKAEVAYRSERNRIESNVTNAVGEADELESEVISLKNAYSGELAMKEGELRTLQGVVEEEMAAMYEERAGIQAQVLAALDVLMLHKQKVQDNIEAVKNTASELVDKIKSSS